MNLRKRLKRIDILDYAMIKTACMMVGVVIAVYFSSIRGFVEQNLLAFLFLMAVISVRPMVRFWKK